MKGFAAMRHSRHMRLFILFVPALAFAQGHVSTPLGAVALWNGAAPGVPGYDTRVRLGETPLAPDGRILVSATQLQSFADAPALARYLSHMKAHAELGHLEKIERSNQLLRISPHIPEKYAGLDLPAMEAEANQRGGEIFRSTPCAQGDCEEYRRALEDLRALLSQRGRQTEPASPTASGR